MPDKVEIWYQPCAGTDDKPLLLESRDCAPGEPVPTMYQTVDGVVLLAAQSDTVMRADGPVRRIHMVDPNYLA